MSTGKQLTVSDNEFGPAMLACSPRQRAFVDAMFSADNYTEAAKTAGYDGTQKSLKVQAGRLAHSTKVQAAFREEAERRAASLLPLAHRMMVDIIKNPQSPDHFKAIKHAQALAGVSPTQKHEVVHRNDSASLKADLLAALDLLKSVAGPMIDVTPVEINDEDWVAI